MNASPHKKILFVFKKIAKDARKRWAALTHLGSSLLAPYNIDSAEIDTSDHVHSPNQHGHRSSTTDPAVYASGDIEISLNLKKNNPKMNVHITKNDGEERHFHDVDLSLLPTFLIPDPFPARVSPLQRIQRFVGSSGIK